MSDEQDRKIIGLLEEWANLNCDDPGTCPLSQDSAGWITSYFHKVESQRDALLADNAKIRVAYEALERERDRLKAELDELKAWVSTGKYGSITVDRDSWKAKAEALEEAVREFVASVDAGGTTNESYPNLKRALIAAYKGAKE